MSTVLSPADIPDMDVLSRLSIQQLKLILNQYELITQHRTKLGNLDAFELWKVFSQRRQFHHIRTVVAVDNGNEFVLTFTAAADKEKLYLNR
ncbi:MAG: hypothetical protein R2877_04505 [Bdellovibrionota bacterium]